MGLIVFLRHGQARNNTERILAGRSPGVRLTEEGVEQSKAAAAMAAGMGISRIYTSPMERAVQTAGIVSEAMDGGASAVPDDRLIELDMGKFTGMGYDDVLSRHGNVFLKFYSGDLELAHNGVETFGMVKRRVMGMVEEVGREHPGENVLLVTHMDPIKAALSEAVDPDPRFLLELVVANASLTVFDWDGGGNGKGDGARGGRGPLFLRALNVMDPSRLSRAW